MNIRNNNIREVFHTNYSFSPVAFLFHQKYIYIRPTIEHYQNEKEIRGALI